MKDYDGPYVQT